MTPPIKWYGGKGMIAKWIVSHFPPHSTYVEPFGGGASVLFAKDPVGAEVYNDINHDVYHFFQTLRDYGDEFIRLATLTPYHSTQFSQARLAARLPIRRALDDFVLWRQSFGAQGKTWSNSKRLRRGMAGNVSAWLSAVDGLPEVVERLRRVEFHCEDALSLIPRYDDPNTLLYCDPPYLHSTRATKDVYENEMSEGEHISLAMKLKATRSKVCLSGYPSALYDQLYAGWRVESKTVANHAAGGKAKRRMTETLWMNY